MYSFECTFHPLFSLTSGTSRLDYLRPENRLVVSFFSFFKFLFDTLLSCGASVALCVTVIISVRRAFYLALFKHMMFLEKRGCPRTALEYCKLILRYKGKISSTGKAIQS